jgi:predicted O-linked N-acetylglucosamine transferase (SPINDLY family)
MSQARLQDALQLRRAGKFAQAAELYRQILSDEPKHFEALHALGILNYQSGQLETAERLIREAVAANPRAADAAYNHACLLQRLNRLDEALLAFDAALAVRPDSLEALVNRGGVLWALKRHEEALANAERVVTLKPGLAEGWNNQGSVLQALERFDEALTSFDRAVALKANYTEAWKNRGAVLTFLRRYDEALQATDKALEGAPNNPEMLGRRADLLAFLNRPEESAAAYERYLTLKPEDANAWYARGFALNLLNRLPEALACFDKAVGFVPGNLAMRESRGSLLFVLERFEEAARDYQMLLAGDAPPSWVAGYLAVCHLHCCDWRTLDSERAAVSAGIKAGQFALDPTGNALLAQSLEEQLQCARIWAREKYPPPPERLWNGEIYPHQRIRIAYLSADFRAHATAFLMAGIFEHHDKARFETIAFSYSDDDKSAMRSRLENSFGRFVDVRDKSDAQVAQMMRDMEIDIAVDLKGYTAQSRPGILSYRPAPVQAHYLGFPGTMGTECIDYLIADPIVIPEAHRDAYMEKIAYLPDTYQCNDSKRRVAGRVPSLIEVGLPATGFVFCCFNNNHKITPEMFGVWMRLLATVEGSVLWLLKDNDAATVNLRAHAAAQGIAAERLVFAGRTDPASHLARQALADLFLDTLPYNAHTTASDALWVGLPILTLAGPTFAGRVAASVLHAAGLPELATHSLGEYEALALALARDPARLGAIKTKLRRNRADCALFDTARMTRNLEAAYIQMWLRYQRGLPPTTFAADGMRGV